MKRHLDVIYCVTGDFEKIGFSEKGNIGTEV